VVNKAPVASKAQMLFGDSKKLISPRVGKRIFWISLALLGAQLNPLSPLSDPLNGAPKRPTPKANS
jgi:hypothetical protein